jgi:hypothetical protein
MTTVAPIRKIGIKEIKVIHDCYEGGFLGFQIIVDGDERGAELYRRIYDSLQTIRRSKRNDLPGSMWWWKVSCAGVEGDYCTFAVFDVPARTDDAAKFYIWLHDLGGITTFPK